MRIAFLATSALFLGMPTFARVGDTEAAVAQEGTADSEDTLDAALQLLEDVDEENEDEDIADELVAEVLEDVEDEEPELELVEFTSEEQAEALFPLDSSQEARELHHYYYKACLVVDKDYKLKDDIYCKCEYYYYKHGYKHNKYYGQVDAAVIVKGHAKLDMNGKKIVCVEDTKPKEAIVLVLGKSNKVYDGYISGHGDCISLRGYGYHSAYDLNLKYCGGSCIHVDSHSSNNYIQYNYAEYCGDYGIDLCTSNYNLCRYNKVYYTGYDGIEVGGYENNVAHNYVYKTGKNGILIPGYKNRVAENYVEYTSYNGIYATGYHNVIAKNVVKYTDDNGICSTGDHNAMRFNKVYNSGDDGIEVGPSAKYNGVFQNYVIYSGDDGIDIEGDETNVNGNEVYNSYDIGIIVDYGANDNNIHNSKVYYSGYKNSYYKNKKGIDLYDGNDYCDNNWWRYNIGYRVQKCIK